MGQKSKFITETSFQTKLPNQHFTEDSNLQMLTFLTLLLSVLMVTVPGHSLELLLYILEQPGLDVPVATQESVAANLSPGLVGGLGASLLTVSLLLAIPATTGYVGAVRENRICLIMVSTEGTFIRKYFGKIFRIFR